MSSNVWIPAKVGDDPVIMMLINGEDSEVYIEIDNYWESDEPPTYTVQPAGEVFHSCNEAKDFAEVTYALRANVDT